MQLKAHAAQFDIPITIGTVEIGTVDAATYYR
jgi:hypothetical protein